MIEKIDKRLIELFTRLSHTYQARTGKTNFSLAGMTLTVVSIDPLIQLINVFIPILPYPSPLGALLFPLIMVVYIKWIYICNQAEESILNGKMILPAFVIAARKPFLRLMFLGLSIPDIIRLCGIILARREYLPILVVDSLLMGIGLPCFFYLLAVDPLPPGRNRHEERSPNKKLVPAES